MKRKNTLQLTLAALCLALAFVLPFLTGQIPQIGSMLSPMHIPVLLCGFLCGWPWGALVGLIAPLLRSLVLGMPPLFPTAVVMAAELLAYGFLSGWLYQHLPKKTGYLYLSLIIAMIGGRIVWGLVSYAIAMAGFSQNAFTFSAFLAGAVTGCIPGIVIQLILIPMIVLALKKVGFMDRLQ